MSWAQWTQKKNNGLDCRTRNAACAWDLMKSLVNDVTADRWDDHWEQFGQAAEIGPTPRYRRRLIRSLLDFRSPGEFIRFLEIGSGTGEFAEYFCSKYPKSSYLGIELSQTGVALAATRAPAAKFLQQDLLKPSPETEFDRFGATHALCSEVLEHLEDPSLLLRNASRFMASGCRMIVTVPGGPMNDFYRHIGHRRHYSPESVRVLLERSGFKVEAAFGAGFPFFNLFRLLLSLRGDSLVSDVSGEPSLLVRFSSLLFDLLFRLNVRHLGWQTIAVARLGPCSR